MVRPWKLCSAATISTRSGRPCSKCQRRASLRSASFASVPLFEK